MGEKGGEGVGLIYWADGAMAVMTVGSRYCRYPAWTEHLTGPVMRSPHCPSLMFSLPSFTSLGNNRDAALHQATTVTRLFEAHPDRRIVLTRKDDFIYSPKRGPLSAASRSADSGFIHEDNREGRVKVNKRNCIAQPSRDDKWDSHLQKKGFWFYLSGRSVGVLSLKGKPN